MKPNEKIEDEMIRQLANAHCISYEEIKLKIDSFQASCKQYSETFKQQLIDNMLKCAKTIMTDKMKVKQKPRGVIPPNFQNNFSKYKR
ncbi:hypothetical protein CMT77_08015 [Elizabethkingia anophelis]|nr:hypothetical protein [Elizabethkingia anophelis]